MPANSASPFAGSDTPAYLEDIPGSFGFDPLGLGSVPSNLDRFREAELVHSRFAPSQDTLFATTGECMPRAHSEGWLCRWAMAGAAGVLGVELAGQGNWYDAPLWVSSALPRNRKQTCPGTGPARLRREAAFDIQNVCDLDRGFCRP